MVSDISLLEAYKFAIKKWFTKANKKRNFQANLTARCKKKSWLDDYKLFDPKLLGSGSTGRVLKVKGLADSKIYALKTINTSVYDKAQRRELKTEVEIVSNLIHPNIVKIYKVYGSRREMKMVMEYLPGGDLASRPPETADQVTKISLDLLRACRYWHSLNKVHRDLKLENILWSSKNADAIIKVIDFGFASTCAVKPTNEDCIEVNRFRSNTSLNSSFGAKNKSRNRKLTAHKLRRLMKSKIGSPMYIAPEVIQNENGYDEKCDLWSIGVIIYYLVTRTFPFDGQTEEDVYRSAVEDEPSFDSPNWRRISPEGHAETVVRCLLAVDPADRWTAAEALDSPWFTKPDITGTDEKQLNFEREIVLSLKKYAQYPRLMQVALMIIAHKADSSQLKQLRDYFSSIDIYKTGTILLIEFQIALQRHGIDAEQARILFNILDQDRTGEIRYIEFLASTIQTQKKTLTDRDIAEAFNHLDRDKSGYITSHDLRSLLGSAYSKGEVNEIIKESDELSKDGKVSKKEFVLILKSIFIQEEEQNFS